MNDDDDFWGEFAIDYSGGTDKFFDFDSLPFNFGSYNPSVADNVGPFDLGGALNYPGDSFNFSDYITNFPGASNPTIFDAQDFGYIDLDNLRYVDEPALPPGIADYYADSVSTPAIDVEGNLVFYNPDGSVVTYSDYTTPGSLVQTQDPSGRNVFYHTTDGRDYAVDYSSLEPGALVETFSREAGGVGPTRYDAYSGVGPDAKHVTYSDVYGPKGGVVTTTSDGRTIQYENGKVYEIDSDGNKTEIKSPDRGLLNRLQQMVDARKTSIRLPDIPELERVSLGRGQLFNPFAGEGAIPLARIDVGSLGNIFPSESVLDRLAGEVPIRVAEGGSIAGEHNPEFYSEGGSRYVRGDGDGTSDSVPAMLARGEYVIPADVVSNIGNGDNEAGAEIMDEFLRVVRSHKRNADPDDLPEDSLGPLSYLEEAKENLED